MFAPNKDPVPIDVEEIELGLMGDPAEANHSIKNLSEETTSLAFETFKKHFQYLGPDGKRKGIFLLSGFFSLFSNNTLTAFLEKSARNINQKIQDLETENSPEKMLHFLNYVEGVIKKVREERLMAGHMDNGYQTRMVNDREYFRVYEYQIPLHAGQFENNLEAALSAMLSCEEGFPSTKVVQLISMLKTPQEAKEIFKSEWMVSPEPASNDNYPHFGPF